MGLEGEVALLKIIIMVSLALLFLAPTAFAKEKT
jgi:hypothetical protein